MNRIRLLKQVLVLSWMQLMFSVCLMAESDFERYFDAGNSECRREAYQNRLLLKAPREVAVQPLLRPWLAAQAPPRNVRIQVDVDPYSFL